MRRDPAGRISGLILALLFAGLSNSQASGRTVSTELAPQSAGGIALGAPWTFEPNAAFTELGTSVATAGDVNGDGYSDIIVGAHRYDGAAGTDQGRAYVFHGSASGTSAAPNWTANPSAANTRFGWRVSTAGDLNGDGYDDVVIGTTSSSRVFVYYGSMSGLSAVPNLEITGIANESLGYSVSTAGDVNADGYDDLLIGAYTHGGSGVFYGRVALHLGSPAGVSATPAWADTGDVTNEFLGFSVAPAGDVNGDGLADIVVGSYAWDPTGSLSIQSGRASCYAGSASGQMTRIWTVNGTGNMRLGETVAGAGDVNGDGYAEILVGAPSHNSNTGWAQIHYGSATGPAVTPSQTFPGGPAGERFGESIGTAGDVDGDGYADWVIGMPRRNGNSGEVHLYRGEADGGAGVVWTQPGVAGSFFGHSAGTAGDVNGDGFSDLVIGAPFLDNGQDNEGRVSVYRGIAGTLGASPMFADYGGTGGGRIGASVASAGDVNADGYVDVLVGAPDWNIGRGRAYLHFGGPGGTSPTPSWTSNGQQAFQYWGSSVSGAGDVNGDGYDDFLVGSPEFDAEVVPVIGHVRLFYGSPTLPFYSGWQWFGVFAGERCGDAVASAGDVDGDGYADILVGCPGAEYGGFEGAGRALLFHGSASGPGASPAWTVFGVAEDQRLGRALAGIGDVDGDGFDDVLTGAPGPGDSTSDVAQVRLFMGAAGGLSPSSVPLLPNVVGSSLGASVAAAGDVNGDGYADFLVGDPTYEPTPGDRRGAMFLYYGAPAGSLASPDWTYLGPTNGEGAGDEVAGAGDVNGDGFSDLITGSSGAGNDNHGRVNIFLGSATGPAAESAVEIVGPPGARLGSSVAGAGDTNGDGFGDVVVGESSYESVPDATEVGRARVHPGGTTGVSSENDNYDFAYRTEVWNGDPLRDGNAIPGNALRCFVRGQSAAGRTPVRLEWQAAPVGASLDSAPIQASEWIDTGPVAGGESVVSIEDLIDGLPIESRIHLRYRVASRSPFFPHTHWLTPDDAAASLRHFLTGAVSGVDDGDEVVDGQRPAHVIPVRVAPNPFTASGLEIYFDLPAAGPVRAEVFDVAGRLVASPGIGHRGAGSQAFTWNGRLSDGAPAPRGVYFVRVSGAGAVGVVRVVRVGG
jgi:hypothetical protein